MANVKVRQEINILDAIVTGATDDTHLVSLDTTKFPSGTTFYLEIVASISAGSENVTLRRKGTTTDDATIAVTGSTTPIRFRSSSFTPPAGATEYMVHCASTVANVKSARILALVSMPGINKMQGQFEIGNTETAKVNTSASPLTNAKYWKYEAANYDGAVTAEAEITWTLTGTGSGTVKLQKDGGSDNFTFADDTTIVSAGTAASATRLRVAFTPTDGRNYQINTVNSSSMGSLSIYNAKVIVTQTNTTGFAFKKRITITGQTGAGTNYQVPLKIGETSGATGEDFDLGGDSLSFPTGKDTGGDFKFTASDGTTALDFWVETVTGTTPNRVAYVWVEVAADLGSNQDIYLFYGNSSPSNLSSGPNTFQLFDDFNDGSIGAEWTTITNVSASITEASDLITQLDAAVSNSNTILSGTTTFSAGVAIRARYRRADIGTFANNQLGFGVSGTNVDIGVTWNNNASTVLQQHDAATQTILAADYTQNAFYRTEIQWPTATDSAVRVRDDAFAQVGTDKTTTGGTSFSSKVIFWRSGDGADTATDFILVRKFQTTEPAFSSAAAAEYATGSITKIQTEYLLGNTGSFGGSTGLKDYDNYYDPADWNAGTGTITYLHEGDGASAGTGDMKLQSDPNGTPADLTTSTITDTIQRERTAAITMPGAAATIDVNVTGTGTLNASRILVQWAATISSGTSYTSTLTETVTLTDSLIRQATKVLSDTITLTATILKTISRTLTETITHTDVVAASRLFTKALTLETLTFTDSLIKQAAKLLSETVTLTDSLIRSITKVLSETITYTDTVLKQLTRTLSETITYTDTLTKLRTAFKVLTETVTHTDTLIKVTGKVLSETVTYTDTVLKQTARALTETITLTATIVKQAGKLLSETVTMTDTILKLTSRALTETITLADTVLKQASRTFTETLTFTDSLIRQAGKFLSETVTLSDIVASVNTPAGILYTKTLTEVMTFTDTLIKQGMKVLTETLTMTDTLLKQISRTLTETVTMTDSVLKQAGKVLADSVTLTATLTRTAGKMLSDTVTLTDTLIRSLSRALTETVTLTATILKQSSKTFLETVTSTDTLLRTPGKVFSEVTTLSDTLIRQTSRTLAETVTLTDSLLRTAAKTLSETVTLTASLVKTTGKVLNEAVTLTDALIRNISRLLTETVALTDSVLVQAFKSVTLTEVITIMDDLTRAFIGKVRRGVTTLTTRAMAAAIALTTKASTVLRTKGSTTVLPSKEQAGNTILPTKHDKTIL